MSATAGISQAGLNSAHARFGDASQNLIAQVMQGTTWHKLVGQGLANPNNLFQAGNVRVVDILGKTSIVTDAPALAQAGTPNKEIILGLAAGAALVHDNRDIISNVHGIVQSFAPNITGKKRGHVPDGRAAFLWAIALAGLPAAIALGLNTGLSQQAVLLGGLMVFGALFAVNSSLHSYLIVSYAKEDGVSLDVGFYYMSNAMGRLIGTVLSGWVYQVYGLEACLWISSAFVLLAALISIGLPRHAEAI